MPHLFHLPLLTHVPHASTVIPDDVRPSLLVCEDTLAHESRALTDHFTDELFAAPPCSLGQVRFPISRLVVDPERFENDAQEPMAAQGMGVIYTKTSLGEPLRAPPSGPEREDLLARYYRPHHQGLSERVDLGLALFGRVLLVDGHSFPDAPLACDLDQSPQRPDFCIGTCAFHTPDWSVNWLPGQIRSAGFSVEFNRPYAGTLVPMKHYQSDARVASVMIEVNRRLYLTRDAGTVCKSQRYPATLAFIQQLLVNMAAHTGESQ